jgi:hypothetical protein
LEGRRSLFFLFSAKLGEFVVVHVVSEAWEKILCCQARSTYNKICNNNVNYYCIAKGSSSSRLPSSGGAPPEGGLPMKEEGRQRPDELGRRRPVGRGQTVVVLVEES